MPFVLLVGFIIFIFGAAIGSFLNASVYRMHKQKPIFFGRSHCPKCGFKLGFFELFPIFSYIFLRRKCKHCKKRIDFIYLGAEAIAGILFVFSFFYRWVHSPDADYFTMIIIRDWVFLGGMIFLFLYDLKYRILPDKVTLPLIAIMPALNIFLDYKIVYLLVGIAMGAGFFLLQYVISRGKWIGAGDIRMGALLGAGLGYPQVILAILAAYLIGALYSAILLLLKKAQFGSEIAFGTFLALGGTVALFFGEKIVYWYFGLIM